MAKIPFGNDLTQMGTQLASGKTKATLGATSTAKLELASSLKILGVGGTLPLLKGTITGKVLMGTLAPVVIGFAGPAVALQAALVGLAGVGLGVTFLSSLVSKDNREKSPHSFEFDRRIDIRTLVPSGKMRVHGMTVEGDFFETNAIDVSLHAIKFEAPSSPVFSIQHISYPEGELELNLEKTRVHRHTKEEAVVIIDGFKKDPDDQMRWIELITRINQEG